MRLSIQDLSSKWLFAFDIGSKMCFWLRPAQAMPSPSACDSRKRACEGGGSDFNALGRPTYSDCTSTISICALYMFFTHSLCLRALGAQLLSFVMYTYIYNYIYICAYCKSCKWFARSAPVAQSDYCAKPSVGCDDFAPTYIQGVFQNEVEEDGLFGPCLNQFLLFQMFAPFFNIQFLQLLSSYRKALIALMQLFFAFSLQLASIGGLSACESIARVQFCTRWAMHSCAFSICICFYF